MTPCDGRHGLADAPTNAIRCVVSKMARMSASLWPSIAMRSAMRHEVRCGRRREREPGRRIPPERVRPCLDPGAPSVEFDLGVGRGLQGVVAGWIHVRQLSRVAVRRSTKRCFGSWIGLNVIRRATAAVVEPLCLNIRSRSGADIHRLRWSAARAGISGGEARRSACRSFTTEIARCRLWVEYPLISDGHSVLYVMTAHYHA